MILVVVDEVFSSLPLGEGGPLAVDEVFSSLPLGEGGPLAVDEGCFGILYPHPGFADPLPGEGLIPQEGWLIIS